MSNANYNKGRALEHRARKWLKRHGWFVIRSAGSKTCVDLCCFPSNSLRTIPRLIQVKSNHAGNFAELRRLKRKLWRTEAQFEIWVYHDGVRNPEVIVV